jgi:hypothetical protein
MHFNKQCPRVEAPSSVKLLSKILSHTSYGIVCLFMIEVILSIIVFKRRMFTRIGPLSDVIIVFITFGLDTVALVMTAEGGSLSEFRDLLLAARLWRVVRVVHGIAHQMRFAYETKIKMLKDRILELESEQLVKRSSLRGYGNKHV